METASEIQALEDLSDENLAKKFQQGWQEAGELLFARHRSEFIRYARRVYAGEGERDPEDIVQEAYLAAFAGFNAFEPKNYVGWMVVIIRRIAGRWRKADMIRTTILGTRENEIDINNVEGESAPRQVEKDARMSELIGALNEALAILGERDKRAATFMTDFFKSNGELPSVRAIEEHMQISHGNAQRARESVLGVWKPICEKRGLWPLI